jgi:hypothetical protein
MFKIGSTEQTNNPDDDFMAFLPPCDRSLCATSNCSEYDYKPMESLGVMKGNYAIYPSAGYYLDLDSDITKNQQTI